MDILLGVLGGFWATLCEMAPYLLLGFAVAGALAVIIPPETVERHLGGADRPIWAVVKATLVGIPLPLCSCGVIPVAASLRRHGASRGAAASFLISTPQTGVDSIMVTYGLLGPVFMVFRPMVALIAGVTGGSLVSIFAEKNGNGSGAEAPAACSDDCCAAAPGKGKLVNALRYGFVTLPKDIGSAMLVGLVIAGLIAVLIPPHYFQQLLGPLTSSLGETAASIVSMLVMMVVGIPLYVCATASVPIAAALIAKGVSPGAALVFLMTGPATNAATIATIWKVMGRRTAGIYLFTVAAIAFASGLVLDLFFPGIQASVVERMSHEGTSVFAVVSGVVLLAVLLGAYIPRGKRPAAGPAAGEDAVEIPVKGMSCTHCSNSVKKALSSCEGVSSAEVDLESGKASVKGRNVERERLVKAIEELGYSTSEG